MFLAPQVLALSYLKEAVVLVNEIFGVWNCPAPVWGMHVTVLFAS
jgi:hypothetical protein